MLCRNAFAQGDACIECRCEQPGGKRISHGEARTPRITAELVGTEFGGKLPEMKKRFRRRHFGQIRQIEQTNHKAPGALNSSRAGRSSAKCAPSFLPSYSFGLSTRPKFTAPGTLGYQSLLGSEIRNSTWLFSSNQATISGPFLR